ncbi:head maturation protease, ClpP-related [Chitiniphilus eburneus]|uniref:head maturation protease, ClpP-related n=1 Tax=Chitiniphilus eburneus TaxID=2571148 RepID=UPI0035CF56B2
MNADRHLPRIYAKAAAAAATGPGWYQIARNQAADGTDRIEILIYDEIGTWGLRAIDFLRELKAADDGMTPIVVGINSIGGEVFDGIAIHNAIKRLGDRVTVRIDGIAASIASMIAVAAPTVVMPENTMMMIHNPWTIAWGEADDLRATADMMDTVRNQLVTAYLGKATELDRAELIRMLDDTTWLTAAEAVALGLADIIGETVSIKASAERREVLARLKNIPGTLLDAVEVEGQDENEPAPADPPAPVVDAPALAARITQACAKAGTPELAAVLIDRTQLRDDSTVTAALKEAETIRTLCATAKLPELTGDFVRAGLGIDAVRARLFDKLVAASGADISNLQPAPDDESSTRTKAINPTAIYAARKGAGAHTTQGAKA